MMAYSGGIDDIDNLRGSKFALGELVRRFGGVVTE